MTAEFAAGILIACEPQATAVAGGDRGEWNLLLWQGGPMEQHGTADFVLRIHLNTAQTKHHLWKLLA